MWNRLGIEYLIQNGFMEGDSNEILTEIDKKSHGAGIDEE